MAIRKISFACGTVMYSVYRGNTAGFTPSASNRIATGISGTSFVDDANLTSLLADEDPAVRGPGHRRGLG